MSTSYRVVVVDDHEVVRTGTGQWLERHGFVVVGDAMNVVESLEVVGDTTPDVVLTDLSVPGSTETGEIVVALRKTFPKIPVVVFTAHVSSTSVRAVFQAGASGFVSKLAPLSEIPRVLLEVVGGAITIDSLTATEVLPEIATQNVMARTGGLTVREREILVLAAEGQTNVEIAALLGVSRATVASELGRLMDRFGARSRTNLIAKVLRAGLLN